MLKKMMQLRRKKGFTLIELIVVIAIIGVLAAILIPTMIGYTVRSHVTNANRTASELHKAINYFLTEANTQRFGMFASASSSTTGVIEVTGSVWSLSIADPSVFVNTSTVSWSGNGTGEKNEPPQNLQNAEDLLATKLADEFREVETAYIGFCLQAGVCRALYFCDETDRSFTIQSYNNDFTGWSSNVYSWDTKNAGICHEGYVVGTYPVLELG